MTTECAVLHARRRQVRVCMHVSDRACFGVLRACAKTSRLCACVYALAPPRSSSFRSLQIISLVAPSFFCSAFLFPKGCNPLPLFNTHICFQRNHRGGIKGVQALAISVLLLVCSFYVHSLHSLKFPACTYRLQSSARFSQHEQGMIPVQYTPTCLVCLNTMCLSTFCCHVMVDGRSLKTSFITQVDKTT